jgi:ribosome-binding factor A
MVSKARSLRIAERIQRELAQLLITEISDPRLRGITVTDAEVDRELAYATIYVSAYDSQERKGEVMSALEGAKGFIRRALAGLIPLRTFPQLRFRWDDTPDRGARVEELLQQLAKERKETQPPGSADQEPDC